MAVTVAPRSVPDATRFTATTPHASARPDSSTPSASRFQKPSSIPTRPPARSGAAAQGGGGSSNGGGSGGRPPAGAGAGAAASRIHGESMEQRIARLRAAHDAAKSAKVSRFDRLVDRSRRFFDSAHRVTVYGLVGISVLTGVATVYTVTDMFFYNRRRKAEFLAAQREMEASSLAAARLAYMTGKATPDQVALVEEANASDEARARAGGSGLFKQMPDLLGAPEPGNKGGAEGSVARGVAQMESEAAAAVPSLSGQAGQSAVGSATQTLRNKAKDAFEAEKDRQRRGGPLDRIGVETAAGEAEPKRRGWFW